jgi:hypothetical protein
MRVPRADESRVAPVMNGEQPAVDRGGDVQGARIDADDPSCGTKKPAEFGKRRSVKPILHR